MHPAPQITTVIPTYRRPKTLKRAVQSILNQSYPHFQVCIYDNASGDETAAVVRELMQKDPRVKYHCHSTNIGSNANFQYGLEHVTTPYFSFLSDDDFVLPNFYETTLEGFKRYPEIAFCGGRMISIDLDGKINSVRPEFKGERYFSLPDGALEFFDGEIPLWTSILFKKEAVDRIGSLRQDLLAIDLDFVGRIAISYPFLIKSQPCAIFVVHPDSISHSADMSAYYPGIFSIIHRLKDQKDLAPVFRDKFEKIMMKKLAKIIFFIGLGHSKKKNFTEAHRAAAILTDAFNKNASGSLLAAAALFAEKMPLMYAVFYKVLRRIYRLFKRRLFYSLQDVNLVKAQLKQYSE